jgi:uncharacterized membrane protein
LSGFNLSRKAINFIMQTMASFDTNKKKIRLSLVLLLLVVLTILWMFYTPPGISGKAHAVGYAVCHQIESHTLKVGDQFLPLCSRCTGMYLGILTSLLLLSRNNRSSGTPSKVKIGIMVVFFCLFIVDGVNSTLGFLSTTSQLYPPNNLFRLITGLLMGIVISNLIWVLWNQTFWKTSSEGPALDSWRRLFGLVIANALVGLLVWAKIPILYFPIAILSTGTVLLILGIVHSLLWIIIFKKENSFETYSDGLIFLSAGLLTALIQVGLMDLLRFTLTDSWQGFQF